MAIWYRNEAMEERCLSSILHQSVLGHGNQRPMNLGVVDETKWYVQRRLSSGRRKKEIEREIR